MVRANRSRQRQAAGEHQAQPSFDGPFAENRNYVVDRCVDARNGRVTFSFAAESSM
jgi:hypothetical protein